MEENISICIIDREVPFKDNFLNLRSVTCDKQENSYHAFNHIIRVIFMRYNCVTVTETTNMYDKYVRYL